MNTKHLAELASAAKNDWLPEPVELKTTYDSIGRACHPYGYTADQLPQAVALAKAEVEAGKDAQDAARLEITLKALRTIARGVQMDMPHRLNSADVANIAKEAIDAAISATKATSQEEAND